MFHQEQSFRFLATQCTLQSVIKMLCWGLNVINNIYDIKQCKNVIGKTASTYIYFFLLHITNMFIKNLTIFLNFSFFLATENIFFCRINSSHLKYNEFLLLIFLFLCNVTKLVIAVIRTSLIGLLTNIPKI